jgi:uncharacterized membrane protein YhaH (DUF805 family)
MKGLSPTAPLGRLPYTAIGVLLALVKFGVDAAIGQHFGHPFSPRLYIDPVAAPLLHPGEMLPYWLALSYAAAPFFVVGVLLTLRRLRDAGASPWLALFFFVPFANLLFFVATALLPPVRTPAVTREAAADPYRAQEEVKVRPGRPRGAIAAVFYASALGAVVALGGFGVSVGLLGTYGDGLALGTPFIAAFVSGLVLTRIFPDARGIDAFLTTTFTLIVSVGLLVAFALEGLGCLVVFLPLIILPAALGTWMGFVLGQNLPRKEHGISIAAGTLLLLLAFGVEHAFPDPPTPAGVVETTMLVDAPPEKVWPLVVAVETMPPPTEFPFRAGIAYPIRATLDAPRVGAVRRCHFNTGVALETVITWDPPRKMTFTIDHQPDPLRELTIYDGVRQPHLDGAVRNRLGEFELLPEDGGRKTRLLGRSWYELSLHPTFYWEAYATHIVHAIHLRVMRVVKERAEAPPQVASATAEEAPSR